jgi:DnaJ-domain-containing protein 1
MGLCDKIFLFVSIILLTTSVLSESHYSVLGVGNKASQKTIKKAYHKLALLNHPDKVKAENLVASSPVIRQNEM